MLKWGRDVVLDIEQGGCAMERDEIELIAVRCRLELEKMGLRLRLVRDLSEMAHLYEQLEKPISAAANSQRLLLTYGNCFSIFCFEGSTPVLGFVVRIDELAGEDAASFLPRSIETIFQVKVVASTSNMFAGQMWGRCAYFGDLKAAKRTGLGSAGKKILRLATAYAHYRAFNDYGTDTHYCFLRGVDARNGVPYGFLEADPYVWETDKDLYKDGSPEWVMQLSKKRLPALMSSMRFVLPELLAVDDKPRLEVIPQNAASST